jgi:hypothetical protein
MMGVEPDSLVCCRQTYLPLDQLSLLYWGEYFYDKWYIIYGYVLAI